jgi:hypothetical protein
MPLMRARLIRENTKGNPGYGPGEEVDLPMTGFILGEFYYVLGIYQVGNNSSLLLFNEFNHLVNRISYCFELETMVIPNDWRIIIVNNELTIMIGPEFMTESYESFSKMTFQEQDMLDKLEIYLTQGY